MFSPPSSSNSNININSQSSADNSTPAAACIKKANIAAKATASNNLSAADDNVCPLYQAPSTASTADAVSLSDSQNVNAADNNDNYSLASSISRSSFSSRADNSLIFERLVQDPLIDAQPIPHSLPRHISSETFIPASLDTTTHMILNNDSLNISDSMDSLSAIISGGSPEETIQLGFNSRRSSLANLEAALGPSSRRPSNANLQAYRMNSNTSINTLSRSQTNSSFSNLTQQFQNVGSKRIPQNSNNPSSASVNQIPQSQPLSQSSSTNNSSNFPPLTTTLTSSSVNSQRNNSNPSSTSPMLKNKSFCSYADIIAQDDQESKFQIRRPSISLSLSTQKLVRTNSMSSQLGNNGGFGACNSPRSPSNCVPPTFANSFRSNSISTSMRNSPSLKPEGNYTTTSSSPLGGSAIADDSQEPSSSTVQSRRPTSGFSGRPINMGGYSMRLSNSSATTNSANTNNSTSQNSDPLLSLKKKDISPQSSRSIQSDLISDEESIKSFKTANIAAE